jgi:hypothetical protein
MNIKLIIVLKNSIYLIIVLIVLGSIILLVLHIVILFLYQKMMVNYLIGILVHVIIQMKKK